MVGYKEFIIINITAMKNIFNNLIWIVFLALISGCEKELSSEGVSKVTYYVTIQLTNGPLVTNPKGSAYVDPGYKATEGTTDVTSKVTVDGSVDVSKVGLYELTYKVSNTDGFPSAVSRTVIVYDPAAPATDISGDYLSNVSRVSPGRAFTGLSVNIIKQAPGVFYISDLLGGFYDQGSNYRYGKDFALTGYLQLNADNSLTYISSYNAGWRDSANSFSIGIYNPVTKGITWNVNYIVYDFLVALTLI
jgi:hypothetical protein